jgi:deoxyribodipyrimidine photo-lyase
MMPRSPIPVKNMLLRKSKMATGWMSNRGRQNVASYLIHDLGINWIEGAKFFEKYLIDYDPTSKYCIWRCNAGIGS